MVYRGFIFMIVAENEPVMPLPEIGHQNRATEANMEYPTGRNLRGNR